MALPADIKIAVVGLGYVGLPVALALGRRFPGTVGFDVSESRVSKLNSGTDSNADVEDSEIAEAGVSFTANPEDLRGCNFFVVAVPTPIDIDRRPDLTPLRAASRMVGSIMAKGSIVVFESTVYPGVTEEVCGPIIAETSGFTSGVDFKLGYSPERINPGDKEHTLQSIIKVVSGEDAETLDTVASVYESIVHAGVHRASSIKVAEAAKVIENTQRDLNIALMNELAMIFDRLDICTHEVLDAAATKWNFLRFSPGLVGGHCIGVDPYYLTSKAEQLGYKPEVILAGRRINDTMGGFIGQRTVKLLSNAGMRIKGAKVGILGVTFKENVSDLRNSLVPTIVKELESFGVEALVHDPHADPDIALKEYGIKLRPMEELDELSALVYAVSHSEYLALSPQAIEDKLVESGVLVDVKGLVPPAELSPSTHYWAL